MNFKRINDLKLITKLTIAFVIIILITVVNGYIGYINLNKQKDTVHEIGNNILPSVHACLTLYQAETSVLCAERGVLNEDLRDMDVKNSIYASIGSAFKRAQTAWNIYAPLKKTHAEDSLWQKFVPDWKSWKEADAKVIALQKEIDGMLVQNNWKRNKKIDTSIADVNLLSDQALRKFDKAKISLKELVVLNKQKAAQFDKTAIASINSSKTFMLGTILLSMLLVIGFIPILNKIIAKPIKQLDKIANNIINGDYSTIQETKRKDEIGTLTHSFIYMIKKIKDEIALSKSFQRGINGAFFTADKDLKITYINQTACDMIDYSQKPEEIIDKLYVKDVFLRDSVTRKALNGEFITAEKVLIENHQGDMIPVLISTGPLEKNDGESNGIFAFFNDLRNLETDQKEYLKAQIAPIEAAVQKLVDGDFTAEIQIEEKAELYALGMNINRMMNVLNNTIGKVKNAIEATASAAEQISSSSEEMAAGAQEQTTQITEIAGSVEQMTKTILETAKNITEVSSMSEMASKSALVGTEKTENTKEGMNKIVKSSSETARIITSLTGKTDQIGEITLVINDIADQTNLLALNAAIEAARAGEQGRGFAVVADEVRKLAERTTKATKEIAETIKSIQQEVKDADHSMNEANKSVEEGMKLTEEVDFVLKDILNGTRSVSDLVNQVAATSEEQSSTAEIISKNIENINNVTHESASGTSQIARAAEDLTQLTFKLRELVNKFQLRNDSVKQNKIGIIENSNKEEKDNFAITY